MGLDGVLTRRGKVVYRTHRNKRDRVKHIFRLPDAVRVFRSVAPDLDSTYFINDTELARWLAGERNQLQLLFEIFESASDLLQMVWISAPAWLKTEMLARLVLNNIIRKLGGQNANGQEER